MTKLAYNMMTSENFRPSIHEVIAKDFEIDLSKRTDKNFVKYFEKQVSKIYDKKLKFLEEVKVTYENYFIDIKDELFKKLENFLAKNWIKKL